MQLLEQETQLGILPECLPLHPFGLIAAHILAEDFVLLKPVNVWLVSLVSARLDTIAVSTVVSQFMIIISESIDHCCFITLLSLVVKVIIMADSVDLEATTYCTEVNCE